MNLESRSGLRRWCARLLALCLLTVLSLSPASAQERQVIRVGVAPLEGYSEVDEHGNRHGLIIDYLNEIAKYTGWKYEYVDVSGNELTERLLTGDYEIVGGNYYIPEMTDLFAYPRLSTGHSKSVILALRDNHDIKSYQLSTLNGMQIGVREKATENIRRLEEFLRANGVEYQLRRYTQAELSETSLDARLEQGEVDLILGNSTDGSEQLQIIASFDAQPQYIVTRPDCPDILAGLNMALEHIVDSDPAFAQERYDANFSNAGTPNVYLNAEELAYVQEKATVTVSVPERYHPLFCLNDPNDLHNGIVPDILAEIEAFSGLHFEYVYAESYMEALQMVQRGEVDMAGVFLEGETKAIEMGLSLSKHYVTLSNMVIRNKSVSYPNDDLTCVLLDGRVLPPEIAASEVGHCANVTQALEMVNKGTADFTYGLSARMEQIIQRQYLSNVVPISLFNSNSEITFALTKPAPVHLLNILNKSIAQMGDNERAVIANRNLTSLGANQFSLRSLIYFNPILFVGVICLVLGLVVLVVLLSARAKVRAAVMRSELERAEAESRARGTFLSRMSHEIRTPMNAVVGLADLTSMMPDVPEGVQTNLSKIRSSSHYLLSLINDILDMSRIDNGMLSITAEPFSITAMLNELQSMMGAEAARRGLEFSSHIQIQHDGLTGDAIRLRQVLTNLLSNACKFTPAGNAVRLKAVETGSDEMGATFLFSVRDDGVGISPEDQARIFNAFEQAGAGPVRSQGTGLGLPISHSIVALMGGQLELSSRPGEGSDFYFTITLPYGTPEQKPELPHQQAKLLDGASFLLAEDNDLNAEIAIHLLEMQGAQVRRAENGQLAAQLFASSDPGAFDAILMDIQMPVMDGLEATRTIRAMDRPDAATVPIFATTANTFKEDTDAAIQAGMDGFIAKPLDVNHLFAVLHTVIAKKSKPPRTP